MVIGAIVLRQHALINRTGIIMDNRSMPHINDESAMQDILMHSKTINPQEFVFCNANELASFEHKKKERAQRLIEQLCSITQVDIQRSRNLLFARVALRAIAMNNGFSMPCNRQQFGIPCMRGNNSIGRHDYASHTCVFVKQIARKQVSENNILQKPCRLTALEKLLK